MFWGWIKARQQNSFHIPNDDYKLFFLGIEWDIRRSIWMNSWHILALINARCFNHAMCQNGVRNLSAKSWTEREIPLLGKVIVCKPGGCKCPALLHPSLHDHEGSHVAKGHCYSSKCEAWKIWHFRIIPAHEDCQHTHRIIRNATLWFTSTNANPNV